MPDTRKNVGFARADTFMDVVPTRLVSAETRRNVGSVLLGLSLAALLTLPVAASAQDPAQVHQEHRQEINQMHHQVHRHNINKMHYDEHLHDFNKLHYVEHLHDFNRMHHEEHLHDIDRMHKDQRLQDAEHHPN